MTFGNASHFYQLCERTVQNEACRIISQDAESSRRISPRELLRAFSVLVGYRNICAHDERLYCANVKGASFDGMVRRLAIVLPEREMAELADDIGVLLTKYEGRLDFASLSQITHTEFFKR